MLLSLAPRIPLYWAGRYTGRPFALPFNITYSVTARCNSRCLTCNIWKQTPGKDLSLADWQQILSSLGRAPAWITISGGEPFLREDFAELMRIVAETNRPDIITIATNGILTDKIVSDIQKILEFFRGALVINLSIDGDKELHDRIRGTECFDRAAETLQRLKALKKPVAGIHSVISKHNAEDIAQICDMARRLEPGSFICQKAEVRGELGNQGMDAAPSQGQWAAAADYLLQRPFKAKRTARIACFLRSRYYQLSKNNASPACFAGIASAHINHDGRLWACCVRCESMGSLKEKSFKELWTGQEAARIRERIRKGCSCSMANAFYSNILCQPACAFF